MLAHCQNLPLAQRAFLRGHAQFCLCRASALAAASGACHAGSVPQVTGFAGIHATGERVGIGGGEARSGKFSNRGTEVGHHLPGAQFRVETCRTLPRPRFAAMIADRASVLPSVCGSGLMGADHEMATSIHVPVGSFCGESGYFPSPYA